ncbi:MFS general substrate transporter [Anaeromyces robustus]|uniref:MFS general substrate transporter n=1 Tax=Anaeromyces robustus TaxID=1754192 RepID=A0A1Y1VR26_9FUNG|nr:MFS general substrate transporter [Anaeromyces robustus]|eukprot:ORX63505.1 MFS general substrate transporter [Anaeromyces robustus]
MNNPQVNHKESQLTLGNSNDSVVVDITDKTINELKKEEALKDDIEKAKDVNISNLKKHDESSEDYVAYEVTGGKLYAIVLALAIICLLASLDMTIVATALPTIAKEFNDISGYTWVITSYMLSSTAFQPMYGKLADIFGRRAIMLLALVIFILSSVFCGISSNMDMLIVFRGIQGIGGGGLMSLCMIVIADIIPIRKRGQFMGLLGAVASCSTVIGPLVGGLFTDQISWRWAFYINVPLALIAFVIILLFVKIPTNSDNLRQRLLRIDYSGTVVLIFCVICLLLALEWGGVDYPWSSWKIILLFCLFAVFLVIFIIVELKFAKEPIIPPQIFKVRNINCMIIAGILIGFAFMGTCTYIPLYFQMVRGAKATVSGLMMTPMSVIVTILSIGSGAFIGKYGHVNWLFIIGFIFSAASGYVYSLFDVNTSTIIQLLIVSFGAIGTGLTRQNLILVAQDSAPKSILASTTAVLSFFQVIGGIVGIAIFNTVLNNTVPRRLHQLSPEIKVEDVNMKLINTYGANGLKAYNDGLRYNFLIIIPCSLLALLACLCTKNVRLNRKPEKSANGNGNSDTSIDTIKPEMKSVEDIEKPNDGATVVDIDDQNIETTKKILENAKH